MDSLLKSRCELTVFVLKSFPLISIIHFSLAGEDWNNSVQSDLFVFKELTDPFVFLAVAKLVESILSFINNIYVCKNCS